MIAKRRLTVLMCVVFVFALQLLVSAVPSAVPVTDKMELSFDNTSLFSDGSVFFDIGEKAAEENVRYAEIDGVQTEIVENNNKYSVTVGDKNLLVEITEKKSASATDIVKSQYFYVDASSKIVIKLGMDTFMKSYEEKSIRTATPIGVRFRSHILNAVKFGSFEFAVDEYGYIITLEDLLGSEGLTLDSSKYVKGVAFNREEGTDIVYDKSNDEFSVFTGVLKNIPPEHYQTELVCKTYTKISVGDEKFVVYGEPITGNVYEIAKDVFGQDYTDLDIAKIVFDYASVSGISDEGFSAATITSELNDYLLSFSGTFNNVGNTGYYYVYCAGYDEYGALMSVSRVRYTLKEGYNSFKTTVGMFDGEKQAQVFVFTEDLKLVGTECKGSWQITEKSFYDNIIASESYFADNTYFEPDSDVSNLEAVAFVSNIHALCNGKEITPSEKTYEHIIEFDDDDMFVDLNDRNSVNLDKINLKWATGGIDEENGYLYGQAVGKNGTSVYDSQVVINGLNLDARKYGKITVRMKLENAAGSTTNLVGKPVQIYFKTSSDNSIDSSKCKTFTIRSSDLSNGWFERSVTMSSHEDWKDIITGIRFDPTDYNVNFYIDYIKFSESTSSSMDSWYDMYLDYAIENKIISVGQFKQADYTDTVSKVDLIKMLFAAVPNTAFDRINNITALPDIGKNDEFSEIYLLLYNAGITLGFDEDGNVLPNSPITRNQLAAMANRILVPQNRLEGTIDASWDNDAHIHDYEFNDESDLKQFTITTRMTNKVVENGVYSFDAAWDSYMVDSSVSIDADKYTKIKIRIKADYASEPNASGKTYNVYFKPEDFDGDITHYTYSEEVTDYYRDALGWYVIEIDMCLHPKWRGNISYFRFDPMNSAGSYQIDYIRFLKSDYADYPDQESLINAGYTATKLFPDGFEDGFVVSRVDQSVAWPNIHGMFNDYCSTLNPSYNPSVNKPMWIIGPWWQGTGEGFTEIDLIESRDTTKGIYTLADTYGVNTITYNPELDSITQRLNATKIYNGLPHNADTYTWWPHQLLDTTANYTDYVDKEKNSADADRMFVELDIRMTDFKNTTNAEGMNVCSYLAYFYLRPKAQPSHRIWFGLRLFNTSSSTADPIGLTASTSVRPGWAPDSAAHQYMYGIPAAVVYDGIENSFNPSVGVADVSDEWKHIRLDITPHIDRAIEWANRDNIFGFEVAKEDMFFNGVNIGYEIHGNYDCTIEIKNFNMVAYNK